MSGCIKLIPITREYDVSSCTSKPHIELKPCVHRAAKVMPTWYPGFDIGLNGPFILDLGFCKECKDKATKASVLTDERWERMQAILAAHDVRIPDRSIMKLQFFPSQADPRTYYAYALAA